MKAAGPTPGGAGSHWRPEFRDALPDAPLGLPTEHPGEIIVELKPGAFRITRVNPLGIATSLLELLAMLRREHGLLSVEPLWPVGVDLFPKIPKFALNLLPPQIREFLAAMTGQPRREDAADEESFDDLREAARLRLLIRLDPEKPVSDAVKRLLTHAGVEFAEAVPCRWAPAFDLFENSEKKAIFTRPPQPGDQQQYYAGPNGFWGRETVFAPEEWTEYELDNIAVLDSGCDDEHPALRGAVVYANNESRKDLTAHGTFVAGIIAARPVTASTDVDARIDPEDVADVERGLLPKAKIWTMNIMKRQPKFDEAGRAYYQVDPGRYSKALAQLAKTKGIRVVNLSIGGPKPTSKTERQDLNALENAGIVVVASAGNGRDAMDPVLYPALYENVLSVGAIRFTEPRDQPWDRSRSAFPDDYSGRRERAVDLWAPGEWILSSVPLGSERKAIFSGWQNGTSMAAPYVTAAAAVLCAKHPEATPAEIRGMLLALERTGMSSTHLEMDAGGWRLVCESLKL